MPFTNQKAVVCGNNLTLYQYSRQVIYGVSIPKRARQPRKNVIRRISKIGLSHTKKALRQVLESNANMHFNQNREPFKPIFITFTFKENVQDLTKANYEFRKFIQRFNYQYFNSSKYLQYVAVPEFQKRGAVHYHVVFFNLPFIEKIYDKIRELWGQGWTLVDTIKDINHLINYVSKYLSKGLIDERLFGRKKYFTSRGLLRPKIFRDMEVVDLIKTLTSTSLPEYETKYSLPEFYQEVILRKFKINDTSGILNWLSAD